MKTPDGYISERNRRISNDAAFTPLRGKSASPLHPDLRQAANRGLEIFPVSELAKLTGNLDLLIGEASSDISRLMALTEENPLSPWRVAIGPSGLCVVEVAGSAGWACLAALNQEQEDCSTLRVERGGMTWALFRWPKGLVLRNPAKRLPPAVRILGEGRSCPIPPSPSCRWANPGPTAEIEAVPGWLRELAFENPDGPPGKAMPVPTLDYRPVPCRSTPRFEKQHRRAQKGYPICDQAAFRGGYRVCRRH